MSVIPDYKRSAILFVDDEEKSLKYFSKIFSNDFRIITSTSVDQAIRILKLQSDEIAILITDQRMPKKTGVDLLKYTKESYPQIIRILTTAYTDLDDAIEAVNKGEIFRYVTKPWNIDRLTSDFTDAMNLYIAREQERNLLAGKRQSMYQLATSIAHELRTPLTSILSAAQGTGNYLPQLVDCYLKAREMDKSLVSIREPHLHSIGKVLNNIETEANHSLTIIDILLTNFREIESDPETFDNLSIRQCIEEALDRYPFQADQRNLITITGDGDFNFHGIRQLVVHVFFNLIKNSLFAIAANKNTGVVTIEFGQEGNENFVYFKDTGTGISASVLPNIFENFYSTMTDKDASNIGAGLPFCKKVLNFFRADINCYSEEGVYTEFILSFPLLQENINPDVFSVGRI